ncbi:cadherin-related [Schistosoma mansoni]|uniref:cadherin-related n=1 Tax=Schistosoma mansoni TaxID=6183 RepID=UPI00022DC6B5|nr:cadherin-related [Schistosoma mansoni]|eukprot:XP_018649494.1 cadherin-related [Schistosoma mansoni]
MSTLRYQLLTQGDDTFELIQLSNELITNLPSLVPSTSINNQPIYSSNFNSLSYETQMEHTYTYHQQPTVNQVLPYQNRPEQLYLKVMKQLDWETKRQYHFILNAEDSGSPAFTGEMSLMIIVTDENDNHPIFRNKSLIINVPENSPEGLHLIQLIADDPDEGLNTMNTNSNSNDNSNEMRKGLFDIDPKTGWLILNDHLDYEKLKHHLIRVIARDQSDHPGYDEAIVSIYVTDINDVAPQITVESVNRISSSQSIHDHHHHQYKNNNVLYVYINETPGRNTNNYQLDNEHLNEYSILTKMTQLLAFIVVNDPDTGPGGTFQCYLEPNTIDSNNNKALRSNIDNGKPSLTSSHVIKVIVQDLNDNPPVFTKDYYNMEVFIQKMIFDRELKQNYRFQVYANDNGQPISLTTTTTIEVTIIDVNDNTPQFVGLDRDNCYHFRIAENQPPNTYVGILLGTDNDIDENAQLHFRLLGTTSNFRLNSSTGELTTLQLLDREKQSNYELIVLLIDHGKPSRSATAKVHIHVTDINDHDPIVVFPVNGKGNISVSYREPPGEIVARIEARDPDEGHNSLLHFNLYSGNEASVFRLGSTSAELIIDRELTLQDIGLYPLIIHIQDAGIPSRTTEVKLLVKITDSPPRHIYSNRFTNLYHSTKNDLNHHPQLKDQPYYHQLINNNNNNNEKLIKINEINNQGENSITTGSILIAIVALSCAIILVLLGIIIYVCERRGFQNFCSNHHITNTNTTINSNIHNNENNHDDSRLNNPMQYLLHNHHSFNNNNNIKLIDKKFHWKNILNSEYSNNNNNITTLYPNKSILIDNHNHNDKLFNYYYHSNNSIQFNHEKNQYIDPSNHLPIKSNILIENNQLNDHDHENNNQYIDPSNHLPFKSNILIENNPFNHDHEKNQYIDPSNNIPFQSILIENNRLNHDRDHDNTKEYTTLPLNEKQYWILKNDEYTLPNQYEQKILSFIHNNHQEKLSRQQQQQQQQHDNDQQNLNMKSTISMNTSTIDFITNTTISSNSNNNNITMVTATDNMMNSSMISNNNKMNPIYFTQSLKLKKSNTPIVNNQNHNISNDPLNNHYNERNPLKTSRSWEYIVIPHNNNQSLSPLSSIKGKHNKPQEQQQEASWISNNQTIPSNKSTTILSPQESTIHHIGNCLSDNQSFTTTCTTNTTATTTTMMTMSTTPTVTSSKYTDYTAIEQNSNHLKTFNKQYHTNLSVLYLNNSKNIIDSNQLNHKQQINNQSFIPINLIELGDQQLYDMKSYPCDHSIMNDSRYPSVSNHSNNSNNNTFIYMINDQQYSQSHHHHHHQNNDNNSPVSTDFV